MYCTNCGTQLSDDVRFCTACGSAVKAADHAAAPVVADAAKKTRPTGKKKRIGLIVLLAAVVLLGAFRLFQYRGYQALAEAYFAAMEAGDQDALLSLYSWEYVEADNQRIIEEMSRSEVLPDPMFFTSETLEKYVFNNDKYYRFCFGEQIAEWEITDVSKNVLSFGTPEMEVETRVVYGSRATELIVRLEMERGSDGWYMTGTDAGYAAEETEGQE